MRYVYQSSPRRSDPSQLKRVRSLSGSGLENDVGKLPRHREALAPRQGELNAGWQKLRCRQLLAQGDEKRWAPSDRW